ncbi:MAG: YifB family Mg chelatase-like AAA ATPase [Gammaproteobacteria bacterium]|nr:YifB family Mg chelatase-like AAA ATPase [Gammaproteobacteria bacterium]
MTTPIQQNLVREPTPRGLAMVRTRTVIGIEAIPVEVEVHLANGLPGFSTVGLPETAVRESKDRVRGALINSGFEFPAKRITVNLAPADLPKSGGRFDLPIAIGILLASGQLAAETIEQCELVGELALDGSLRPVFGTLPTAISSAAQGRTLIVPQGNAAEASLAGASAACHATHLLGVCAHLAGLAALPSCRNSHAVPARDRYPDMSDVKGQPQARRALELAAVGAHSLLMMGTPGSGKSMLANRLPGILPPLTRQQALETAAIRSVASGHLDMALWRQRPFRNPHHSASAVALVGGGSNPRPGEISLAHNGVLFLDELTEFSRATLEHLREPMESGSINIARAQRSVRYPAKFQLVAAYNPCPCGFYGDESERCDCSATQVRTYQHRLSGPLLDRIDIQLRLGRVDSRLLHGHQVDEESSAVIAARVVNARQLQLDRQGILNSELRGDALSRYCELDSATHAFLDTACQRLQLSARAYHRTLKLARSIADMEGALIISKAHVAEAVSYRSLDRPL